MLTAKLHSGKSHDASLRKQHARFLIIFKGYNQKEAAKEVNVSEKTITKWGREGKWNDKKNHKENSLQEPSIKWFLLYVLINAPQLYKRINNLWDAYADSCKIDFNDCGK